MHWRGFALWTLLGVALASTAAAVTAPYEENFDGYANGSPPANFTTALTGSLTHFGSWETTNPSGASGVYTNLVAGNSAASSAAINVTNLDHVDFVLSTTFVITSTFVQSPISTGRVGLGALSTGPSFTASGYQFSYQAFGAFGFEQVGSIALYQGSSILGDSFGQLRIPVVIGTTYTMTLSGVYSSSGLTLIGTLTDGSNTLSLTRSGLTTPNGTYFGYHTAVDGSTQFSSQIGTTFDNFSLSIPEPTTISSLAFGGALLAAGWCAKKRRRR